MNENYIKCKCGEINFIPNQTQGLECYYCACFNEKVSSNEVEEEIAQVIREMIKHLSEIPRIRFIETNISPTSGKPCPSWTIRLMGIYTIFIPRKTCYLPNDEIADTIVHECSHVLSEWYVEEEHNPQWRKIYNKNRKELFAKFANFVNSPNPNAKFTKGYKHFIKKMVGLKEIIKEQEKKLKNRS